MPGSQGAPGRGPGYRPRAATNALKELVEDKLEELFRAWDERFRKGHGPLHGRLRKLFDEYLKCGDPHHGFLRLRCPGCAEEKIVPFSCKSRGLCPSCSKKRAIAWAERMVEEVLPVVPYAGLVFTIPKMLRPHFLWDRCLYSDLCRQAYAATLEFLRAQFPELQGAVPAMIISPQSFGSLLNFHPHLHGVLSLGVFNLEGEFHPVADDLDWKPLEEIFRARTLKLMIRREKITEERAEMLRGWVHSGFQVSADRRIEAGDRKGLESLLEYMERAPVSLERLTVRPDGMVLYRGNYHPAFGTDHRVVSGIEFLALMVPHVLLRYQVSIRGYGAASTRIRKKLGWIKGGPGDKGGPGEGDRREGDPPAPAPAVTVMEEEESGFVRLRRRSWARLIQKVWMEDPELCPRCGERMKVLAAISSPAQDDVIEKILRARGEWDPPWLCRRPARGPPAGEGGGHGPFAETRIEYTEGYVPGGPGGEEIEIERDFVDEDGRGDLRAGGGRRRWAPATAPPAPRHVSPSGPQVNRTPLTGPSRASPRLRVRLGFAIGS
jgi:ribosomal protein S27E